MRQQKPNATPNEIRICNTCDLPKPMSSFSKRGIHYRYICRECERKQNDERIRLDLVVPEIDDEEITRKKRQQEAYLCSKYGIHLIDHVCMYVAQNGRCAICKTPVDYRVVHTDHDHKTGKVRGLLCPNCNTGLGMFKDGQNNLLAAAEYLQQAQRK